MNAAVSQQYCGHCGGGSSDDPGGGEDRRGAEGSTSDAHRSCRQHLGMEPPRFCPQCRRRMKVQVTPLGWTAVCSRHGLTSFCTDTAPNSTS
ncbi:biotin synthase auxiliary protein BsaP [Arthrobacter sp. 9V]|uniref:biotin synthase auxiliary protein BsaP n=1 Tax=Arthrobacter sp. 9V TaxID=2653132 RepID=UPI003FA4356F